MKLYMMISPMFVPRKGIDTRKKGWMETGLDEIDNLRFVEKVSNRNKREAVFIIDVLNLTIMINRSSEKDEDVLRRYTIKHAEAIGQAVEKLLGGK